MSTQTLHRSNIGYVGADGIKPYAWNPGGCGCSNGCPDCWARDCGKRQPCPDCRAFRVHWHPERIGQLAATRKGGVTLVQFTGDLFDRQRETWQIAQAVSAMLDASQHTYVLLSQSIETLSYWLALEEKSNWYSGVTIRNQVQADKRLPILAEFAGNRWISFEPAEEVVTFRLSARAGYGLRGIIVGQNNKRGPRGTKYLYAIRSCIGQCLMAGVNCYVKQLWHNGRLLRASHPDERALYPKDIQVGKLPWEE